MTFARGHSIPQSDPPKSPRETLPTMYDLPSEFPEEPGWPDQYHPLQCQLLRRTLDLTHTGHNEWFTGSNLNIYYDVRHPLHHVRPDWFLVEGVPRLYDGYDLRLSYVVWQEGRWPNIVIELLAPGRESEDLGRFFKEEDRIDPDEAQLEPVGTMGKMEVYERFLKVPQYIVYDRFSRRLRHFIRVGSRFEEQAVSSTPTSIWLPEMNIGLGLWEGKFEGAFCSWLRWCDGSGNWLPTDTERVRLGTEQQRQRAERRAERLRQLGVDPADV
ncbi:hypothetical protein C7271_11715 [filamentous cyanobacterium CCP5]|nr:hypothetical protein C7271_11715 [filamentous cyanobacterium CCP5]